jgi:hypothetical protein
VGVGARGGGGAGGGAGGAGGEGGRGFRSSGSSGVWLRGPSSLPQQPIPLERCPLIRPIGQREVTLDVITTSFDTLKITIETNNFS